MPRIPGNEPGSTYVLGGKAPAPRKKPAPLSPVLSKAVGVQPRSKVRPKAHEPATNAPPPPRNQAPPHASGPRIEAGIPKLERAPGEKALRRVERKLARSEASVPNPAVTLPSLPRPRTHAQRVAVVQQTAEALQRARQRGATPEQIERQREYGPRQTRRAFHRAAGAQRTMQRDVNVKVALGALRAPKGTRPARGHVNELAALGEEIGRATRAEAKPGQPDKKVGVGLATVNTTALGRTLAAKIQNGQGVAAAQFFGHDAPKFLGRGGKDVIDFPRSAVQGLYETGAAGVEAAHGDTKRARRLGKALTEGFGGQLVQGHFDEAAKAFGEHPLYGLLDVAALYGAAGRVAGAGARAGLAGKAAKAAAGTRRADLVLVPGLNRTVRRSYSRNLLTQLAQKGSERALARRGREPNVARPARRERALRSEADEFASQVEMQRRVGRETTRREVGAATGAGPRAALRRVAATGRAAPVLRGPERGVVHLAVERRVRPGHVAEDLQKVRTRLDAEYSDTETYARMSNEQRRGNRLQVKAIDRALSAHRAGRFSEEAVLAAAERLIPETRNVSRQLVRQNVLSPDAEASARLKPYAIEHMDAKPGGPGTGAQVVRKARGDEQAAQRRLEMVTSNVERIAAQREQVVALVKSSEGRVPEALQQRLADVSTALHRARRAQSHIGKRYAQVRARRVQAEEFAKGGVTGLVDAQGAPITARAIAEHMKSTGTPEPGFLTHRPGAQGGRAYFHNFLPSRRTTGRNHRTGAATQLGSHGITPQAIEQSMVDARGVSDAVGAFDSFAHELSVKSPTGKLFTPDEAQRYIDSYSATRNVRDMAHEELVPVRVGAGSYSPERLAEIERAQASGRAPDLTGLVEEKVAEMLRDPLAGDTGTRNVALVPRSAWDRFVDHQMHKTGTLGKAGQKFTGAFRGAVLPFSTKWLTGNVAEAVLRSGIAGVTPVDVYQGRKLAKMLEGLDEAAGAQFDARVRGGLLYGSSDRLTVHRDRSAFAGTWLEKPANVGATLLHAPVVKQGLMAVDAYQRGVFAFNKGIERLFQDGVIGKQARRDMQEMTGSWTKAVRFQREAMRDVAKGLRGSPAQVRYARAVDETLGKYTRFSPTMRRVTQTAMPFLPWYVNSARFVFHTLPVKHPVKAALLANAERAIAGDVEQQRKDVPPGDLGSAIKTKDGGYMPLARYSPFGAFTGEMPESALEPILPQFASIWEIAHGRSWTGSPLQIPGKKQGEVSGGQKALLALYAAFESVIPGVQLARRLQEHGETPADTSTVFAPKTKKGTSYGASALERAFVPWRPVYLKRPRRSAGGAVSSAPDDPVTAARREVARQANGARGVFDDPDVQAARRAAASSR